MYICIYTENWCTNCAYTGKGVSEDTEGTVSVEFVGVCMKLTGVFYNMMGMLCTTVLKCACCPSNSIAYVQSC